MKGINIGITILFLALSGIMIMFAPDQFSMLIVGLQVVTVFVACFLGIYKSVMFIYGFRRGKLNVDDALTVQTTSIWLTIENHGSLFHEKTLDKIFSNYKNKVLKEQDEETIVCDIEDFINEDVLSVRAWQGLIVQIPGTLTGLGLIGTFIGLITGISTIEFSSVEAALSSISVLLTGIKTAFYTSICGVIFSIVFNIINRLTWNAMLRECENFVDIFHKEVLPSTNDQMRMRQEDYLSKIVSRLDRLPKNGFGMMEFAMGGSMDELMNEKTIMPQIQNALTNNEFTFYVQPRIELSTKKIIAVEALARWNHPTLGVLLPESFLPKLNRNGYIVKFDEYIWDLVCKQIRKWIDEGKRPTPVVLNIFKTDILAMDVPKVFEDLLNKYQLPPRFIEAEIGKNSFVFNPNLTASVAEKLRRLGIKVSMDDFDGDFISVEILEHIEIDGLNLDLKFLDNKQDRVIKTIFEKAKSLNCDLMAESIETSEQVTLLKRNGCEIGQGFYFYEPMTIEEYEALVSKEKA